MFSETTDKKLIMLLIRLGRLMTNSVREQLEAEDQKLIGPHMGILVDLHEKDGVRQQDLAVSSIKDKGTITRALQSLEREGFVLRTPDPIDKRTKRIYITPKGRKAFQRIYPKGQEVIGTAMGDISQEELKNCITVLQKMYINLSI